MKTFFKIFLVFLLVFGSLSSAQAWGGWGRPGWGGGWGRPWGGYYPYRPYPYYRPVYAGYYPGYRYGGCGGYYPYGGGGYYGTSVYFSAPHVVVGGGYGW